MVREDDNSQEVFHLQYEELWVVLSVRESTRQLTLPMHAWIFLAYGSQVMKYFLTARKIRMPLFLGVYLMVWSSFASTIQTIRYTLERED